MSSCSRLEAGLPPKNQGFGLCLQAERWRSRAPQAAPTARLVLFHSFASLSPSPQVPPSFWMHLNPASSSVLEDAPTSRGVSPFPHILTGLSSSLYGSPGGVLKGRQGSHHELMGRGGWHGLPPLSREIGTAGTQRRLPFPTSESSNQFTRPCCPQSSSQPSTSPLRNDSSASRSPPVWVCLGFLFQCCRRP